MHVCRDERAAHLGGNLAAAGRQDGGLKKRRTENEQRRQPGRRGKQCCRLGSGIGAVVRKDAKREADNQCYARDYKSRSNDIDNDKPLTGSSRLILGVEEIQVKETSGASRFSSESISRKLARSKLNVPAMTLLGKFSAVLL